MNTAALMESTGQAGKIQVSEDTAKLLVNCGRSAWLEKRAGEVTAEGKGAIQSYWLLKSSGHDTTGDSSVVDVSSSVREGMDYFMGDKQRNLIAWNVDTLSQMLKQVVARREARKGHKKNEKFKWTVGLAKNGGTVLDEVAEIISLPNFDAKEAKMQRPAESIVLSVDVERQLNAYVTALAMMYHDNPVCTKLRRFFRSPHAFTLHSKVVSF